MAESLKKLVTKRAVLTAGIAAGALALPSAAQAEKPAEQGIGGVVYVAPVSEKQQHRNEQAQSRLNQLAKLVMHGPAARKGGSQDYVNALTGERFRVAGVDVTVPDADKGTTDRYSFNVTAPLTKAGNMRLNNSSNVSVEEDRGKIMFTLLNFGKDPQTGAVDFNGIYTLQKIDALVGLSLQATTMPTHNTEARLTPSRLAAASSQIVDAIHAAEAYKPIEDVAPAFVQPIGTLAGME